MIDLSSYPVDLALSAAYDRPPSADTRCRKIREDVDRYGMILAVDVPDVVVELGTDTGASATWFTSRGPDVITVDVTIARLNPRVLDHPTVTCILGDSVNESIAGHVRRMVAGRRAMVVLDSCHSGPHVLRELELYHDIVTPGCHLVIEDGFLRWGVNQDEPGSPLDAIEAFFPRDGWRRDVDLERDYGVTLNPAGWWIRE